MHAFVQPMHAFLDGIMLNMTYCIWVILRFSERAALQLHCLEAPAYGDKLLLRMCRQRMRMHTALRPTACCA